MSQTDVTEQVARRHFHSNDLVERVEALETAGPGGGLAISSFVNNEVPAGTVNGTNTVFNLAHTPTNGTVDLFLNGILQDAGDDYTIAAGVITFTTAPFTGDTILVNYWK